MKRRARRRILLASSRSIVLPAGHPQLPPGKSQSPSAALGFRNFPKTVMSADRSATRRAAPRPTASSHWRAALVRALSLSPCRCAAVSRDSRGLLPPPRRSAQRSTAAVAPEHRPDKDDREPLQRERESPRAARRTGTKTGGERELASCTAARRGRAARGCRERRASPGAASSPAARPGAPTSPADLR